MITLLGRILLGGLFLMAGISKFAVMGIANFSQFIESAGFPGFLAVPAALFEIVAGVMIIVGFLTRYAALALAAFCVFTGIFYHQGPEEMSNLLKNIALAGAFLILYSHGAGSLSIDTRRNSSD